MAQAAFYPNVNLAAFIGYQSLGLSNLFISGSGVGQAGPAVNLPLFDGGQRRANLKGARADYAEAVSYTHLDVYKRQRLSSAASTLARAAATSGLASTAAPLIRAVLTSRCV